MNIHNYQVNEAAKELLFGDPELDKLADGDGNKISPQKDQPWKILLVDDEDAVHQVSTMVLKDFAFDGQPVELMHAYSGVECRRLMRSYDDIAVVIMDVVMETETAGLDAINYIRDELENCTVRIIVRTGQPGMFAESTVRAEYEIDAYLEKSDLTSQRLYEQLSSVLTVYRDIKNR